MSNALLKCHATRLLLLRHYMMDVLICLACHTAMASRMKRSSAPADSPVTRKKRMEELDPTNICTYCPNNPAFDPKRVLLRRLFFINEYRIKYVSVVFYPVRDYLPLVEFGVLRRGDGPKTLILSDEQVDALVETLRTLREVVCSGEAGGCRFELGAFRLDVTRSLRSARLYVDSQLISLTLQVIGYLSRMFSIAEQQLCDYIVALQDVLPCVTATLTSVTYVEPAPEASKNVHFPICMKN